MTIEQAKKILSELGKNLTEEEIKKEIDTAELLADLFFDIYVKNTKLSLLEQKNNYDFKLGHW